MDEADTTVVGGHLGFQVCQVVLIASGAAGAGVLGGLVAEQSGKASFIESTVAY